MTVPTNSPTQTHVDTHEQTPKEHAPVPVPSQSRSYLPPPAPLPAGLTHLNPVVGAPAYPASQHLGNVTYSQSNQLPISPAVASSALPAHSVPAPQSSHLYAAHLFATPYPTTNDSSRVPTIFDPSAPTSAEGIPTDNTNPATVDKVPHTAAPAVTTTVISPPGMPPLDVSMPPLSGECS